MYGTGGMLNNLLALHVHLCVDHHNRELLQGHRILAYICFMHGNGKRNDVLTRHVHSVGRMEWNGMYVLLLYWTKSVKWNGME